MSAMTDIPDEWVEKGAPAAHDAIVALTPGNRAAVCGGGCTDVARAVLDAVLPDYHRMIAGEYEMLRVRPLERDMERVLALCHEWERGNNPEADDDWHTDPLGCCADALRAALEGERGG